MDPAPGEGEMSFTKMEEAAGVLSVKWTGLGAGESGTPLVCPDYPFRTVQAYGTFNGATVVIEGSIDNDVSTATYAPINDAEGDALTFASEGIKKLLEDASIIRPRITGGEAGTRIT